MAECDAWIEEALEALPVGPAPLAHKRLASLAEGIRARLTEMAAP
jgi:hypothetical protein